MTEEIEGDDSEEVNISEIYGSSWNILKEVTFYSIAIGIPGYVLSHGVSDFRFKGVTLAALSR